MEIKSFFALAVLVTISMLSTSNVAQAATSYVLSMSPTETLLVTTYKASLLNYDGIIPFGAKLGTKSSYEPLTAGFKIEDKKGRKFRGETLGGFILSSQPIVQGGYSMPKGAETTLMLATLITHDSDEDAEDLRATLTSLPVLLPQVNGTTLKTLKTF